MEFNELIYFAGDISVVEAEQFEYIKQVERLNDDGTPYLEFVTITFTQEFEAVPEMVAGCYSTVFRNEDEAPLVQDFMTLLDTTILIGNWSVDGEYYLQQGASDFDPQVYDNFLSGVSIQSTILDPLPQVLRPSGWLVRDLSSSTLRTLSGADSEEVIIPKNTDVIILNVPNTDDELIEPEYQYKLSVFNTENANASIDVNILVNDVEVVSTSFSLSGMTHTNEDYVNFLTGVTIQTDDIVSLEVRANRILTIYSVELYMKYQP